MKKKRKSIFRWPLRLLAIAVLVGILFIGGRTYTSIKQVEQYDSEIAVATKKYQMENYKNLIKGIILTESKGKGTDLMQSSESAYGKANMINNQEESIDQGVSYLVEMITEANEQGCDLATAIQAYNFGKDYIAYVKKHGGKNSVELAEEYSKNVLSPLLGNNGKTKYRYWRVQSLLYNGGYLYHNGGNMFYSDVVDMNEKLIELYEKVWK